MLTLIGLCYAKVILTIMVSNYTWYKNISSQSFLPSFFKFFSFIFQGLFGILRDRAKIMEKNGEVPNPILLLSPIQINRWLNFYAKNIEDIRDFIQ